jgi:hypothetical protein
MGTFFDQTPAEVQAHLQQIAKDVKVAEGDDAQEKLAEGWLEKMKVFEEKLTSMNMEEVDSLGKDDEDGALALTYSGSIVNIGPLVDGVRDCSYSSIGVRTQVSGSAEDNGSVLKKDVTIDDTIEFNPGPVKSTSKIYKIAVCKGDLSAEEQSENLDKAVTIMEEEFVEVNKTIMM